MSEVKFPKDQIFKVLNVKVEQKHDKEGNRKLYISSVGFPGIEIPMVQHITSTKVPRAWQSKTSENKKKQETDDTEQCESVIDVLSLIPSDVLAESEIFNAENTDVSQNERNDNEMETLDNTTVDNNTTMDVDDSNTLPDLHDTPGVENDGNIKNGQDNAKNFDNILQEKVDKLLSMKHAKNWKKKNLTCKSLFNEYLCSAEKIERAFKHDELDIIGEVSAKHTGGRMAFKKNALKATEVSCISAHFGDKSTIARTKRKVGKPKALAGMSKNFIMKPTYPKDVLVSSVCRIHYIEKGK